MVVCKWKYKVEYIEVTASVMVGLVMLAYAYWACKNVWWAKRLFSDFGVHVHYYQATRSLRQRDCSHHSNVTHEFVRFMFRNITSSWCVCIENAVFFLRIVADTMFPVCAGVVYLLTEVYLFIIAKQ